jgi:hypothetical protein
MPQSEFGTEKSSSTAAHPAAERFGGFAADWHPNLGQGLADFPRCLALPALPCDLEREDTACWPDFATFIEDPAGRLMMYYPASPSPWSVCVLFRTATRSWQTQLYLDAEAIH